MADQFHRPVSRVLTQAEAAPLRWMLDHPGPQARAYMNQIGRLKVVAECTCGCPTIDLALDDKPAATTPGSLIIADAEGQSTEGFRVNVIVHVRDDVICELEVAAFDHTGPFALPRPAELRAL
jgi:hypothetical protein